jgi:ATP:ADP antiporter, AAA family
MDSLHKLASRALAIERSELATVIVSFAMFFVLLCGYYILRSIRDAAGVVIGKQGLEQIFIAVFVVMLLIVPVFGWLVSTLDRSRIVPLIYSFFALNIVGFWFGLGTTDAEQARPVLQGMLGADASSGWYASVANYDPPWASVFFVWISVYNLFTLSLFWSLMAELYRTGQAKRLFGFVAAGGTLGGMAGSSITTLLAGALGANNLLLISAGCLMAAVGLEIQLRNWVAPTAPAETAKPLRTASVLDGAIKVLTTPFLFRIALYIFIANVVGTYFYLEQSRIVGLALPDPAQRLAFFSTRDLTVSILTVTLELFVTGRLMQRFGLLPSLTALPISAGLALIALLLDPGLQMIAAIMVIERSLAYAISNPAVKVLWTSVGADEKYKAQNFVDTVVYRGGDASSGTIFAVLGRGANALGGGAGVVALAAIPITLAWLWTGRTLAKEQQARSDNGAIVSH